MPNIIEITDFAAPELDSYARLTEGQLLNRHEPDKGVFIAESPKVIERALDAGCVPISMLMEKKHVESQAREMCIRDRGEQQGVPGERAGRKSSIEGADTGCGKAAGTFCALSGRGFS